MHVVNGCLNKMVVKQTLMYYVHTGMLSYVTNPICLHFVIALIGTAICTSSYDTGCCCDTCTCPCVNHLKETDLAETLLDVRTLAVVMGYLNN